GRARHRIVEARSESVREVAEDQVTAGLVGRSRPAVVEVDLPLPVLESGRILVDLALDADDRAGRVDVLLEDTRAELGEAAVVVDDVDAERVVHALRRDRRAVEAGEDRLLGELLLRLAVVVRRL